MDIELSNLYSALEGLNEGPNISPRRRKHYKSSASQNSTQELDLTDSLPSLRENNVNWESPQA